MNFQSILKIEGTDVYQILTYFYCSTESMASVFLDVCTLFNATNYKVKQLHEVDWPFGVVLVEAHFSDSVQAMSAVVESNFAANDVIAIIGSICMFDGAFCGCYDTLAPISAEQIYCVWIRRTELNLAMNEALRASSEWKEVIGNFRKKLRL